MEMSSLIPIEVEGPERSGDNEKQSQSYDKNRA